ncbi:MAG: glycosyltransferase family 9 protein [Alphaproteobacteria bacterium]|nr:MAG: glycosyltransferase family 9 protein [Alphaproteobacteria bacterium]
MMKLLFITSTRIGDAVLSTGLLNHIIAQNPGIQVTIACGAPAAGIFKTVPNLEKIIVVEKKPYAGHWIDLWRQTVGTRWDYVIDLRRSALSYFLRANKRIINKKTDPNLHRVQDMGNLIGINPPPVPKLWIGDENIQKAKTLISGLGEKPLLCIAPTANWGGKMWPADRFAELAKRLTGQNGIFPGANIAIFGAAHERPQAQPMLDSLAGWPVLDLIGKPDLLTCAAIFQKSSLYIGNDSGLMHIAAASGANVIGLFGPSPVHNYGPWPSGKGKVAFAQTEETYEELVYSPTFDSSKQDSLMTSLSVDVVEGSARQLWQRIQAKAAA